ncbi:MAG TPA: hypothetical protein V6D29_20845 [Leptolyngbyaceae cyanobacterium]
MSRNYYPWNVRVLVDWLKAHKDAAPTSSSLPVPLDMLDDWLINPSPDITLQQLQAIARYQSQSLEQTAQWLDIKPAHLEELKQRVLSQV